MTREINEQSVKAVWEVLFGELELEENEFIEVCADFGEGYNRSFYVKTYEELIELLQQLNGEADIAIHYTTKKFEGKENHYVLGKRSSNKHIYRAKAVVLDIEFKDKHKLLSKPEFLDLLEIVRAYLSKYPEIKEAVALVGYTGGGGQLYIAFSRPLDKYEIKAVCDFLMKLFSNCMVVDLTSFDPSHPQRLLGTYSVKRKVDTRVVSDLRKRCVPLDTELIIEFQNKRSFFTELERRRIAEGEGVVGNLREAIALIKERIRFRDLGVDGENKGHYTRIHCPFHPPDNNPSFIVYHNPDGDLAIDFHDGKVYDVIEYYMEENGLNFIEALKELAQKAGVQLQLDKKKYKDYKKEKEVEEFDYEGYIRNELRIKKAYIYRTDEGLHFEFIVENIYGEEVVFDTSLRKIRHFRSAETLFAAYTYWIPERIKEPEIWDTLLRYLIANVAERAEFYDRSTKEFELEALEELIYDAEGTEDFEEFYNNKALKFFDEDGKVYLNIARLMLKIYALPSIEKKTLQHIVELLQKLGAVKVRISKNGKRKRCWLLPDRDWRGPLTREITKEEPEQQEIFEEEKKEAAATEKESAELEKKQELAFEDIIDVSSTEGREEKENERPPPEKRRTSTEILEGREDEEIDEDLKDLLENF